MVEGKEGEWQFHAKPCNRSNPWISYRLPKVCTIKSKLDDTLTRKVTTMEKFRWFGVEQSGGQEGELLKGPAFEKMQLPEYQRNYVENCFVLFSICPIKLSNLSGFNRRPSCRNGRLSAESPSQKPAKTSESNQQDFSLPSFLAVMTLELKQFACNFSRFVKASRRELFPNHLRNLNGVIDFSEEKF